MNNTQVTNARLQYFEGPFFPEIINEFMATQDQFEVHNNYAMKEIADQIPGFVEADVYLTQDGYYWYFGLHFKSNEGEMVVLLPDFGDLNKQTGRMERVRSVAVYTRGKFDIESTIRPLINGIEKRSDSLAEAERARISKEKLDTEKSLERFPDLKKAFDEFAK